jgi:hypothetical protein
VESTRNKLEDELKNGSFAFGCQRSIFDITYDTSNQLILIVDTQYKKDLRTIVYVFISNKESAETVAMKRARR